MSISAAFFTFSGPVQAQVCETDKPIVFGDLDWDSVVFHNEVARFILEKGYGCQTDAIPGSTIPLYAGAVRGNISVIMEVWENISPKVWKDALQAGKVREVGVNFSDAVQGWYVPRYLVEGDDAPAKDLKSVSDLPKYKTLFQDQEEPEKGRFYNCVPGWGCEISNTKKFYGYGLDKDFINYRPGTAAAMNASIESAFRRKQPIVFYYWGPSWIYGKYIKDMVPLQEPAYDETVWKQMEETKKPEEVKQATAYPLGTVKVGVNSAFAKRAPKLTEFLARYRTSNDITSEALVYMQENRGSAKKAALNFLKTREDVWRPWVSPDVAARVKSAL
ncbi:ABC transporter substrate-binding protein [Microvirga sp. W0021]|uniref:ABC transporter substrate-binding protein n=1 Tax=Hohaiivirga grylli TaxID=3133970 RepID=A0ABV0BLA0_9HYPH